jgi:hypothetical protein
MAKKPRGYGQTPRPTAQVPQPVTRGQTPKLIVNTKPPKKAS